MKSLCNVLCLGLSLGLFSGHASSGEAGIVDLIYQDDEGPKKVVIFSANPYLGDNVLYHLPLVDAYRKRFGPDTEIVIASPAANLLREQDGITVVPVRPEDANFAGATSPRAARKQANELFDTYLKAHVSTETHLHMDFGSLDHVASYLGTDERGRENEDKALRKTAEVELKRRVAEAKKSGAIVMGYIEHEVHGAKESRFGKSKPLEPLQVNQQEALLKTDEEYRALTLGREGAYAQQREELMKFFGTNTGAHLAALSRDYLEAPVDDDTFKLSLIDQGVDSTRAFSLLNFNAGPDKAPLTAHYADTMTEIISSLIEQRPGENILITSPQPLPPEYEEAHSQWLAEKNNNGPKVGLDVFQKAQTYAAYQEQLRVFDERLKAINSACGHCVGIIDSTNTSVLANAIDNAKHVVTHDTGLAHIAYARRGLLEAGSHPHEVSVFSLDGAIGRPENWAVPGQNFVTGLNFSNPQKKENAFLEPLARTEATSQSQSGEAITPEKATATPPLEPNDVQSEAATDICLDVSSRLSR